jgi:hypothetical protein
VVAWLPAVCLSAVLALSFVVPWVGSYPAGHPVNTQGLWKATFGTTNRNVKLEESLLSGVKGGGWQDKVRGNWELLLPALFALFVATALAVADRRFSTLEPRQLPPQLRWLAALWPRRKLVVAVLTAFALALIVIQVISGFGLQKAINRAVANDPVFVKEREAAGGSEAERARVEFRVEQEVARYGIEYTFWANLSILLLALAVVAVMASAGLDARGNKPPPRVMLQY